MAPTICKDERNVSNERRTRNGIMKHRNSTVISYAAGRHVFDPNMYNSTSESGSSSSASSDSNMQSTSAQMPVSFSMAGCSGNSVSSVLNSSEYRGVIERNNRQNKLQIDDDSTDSSSSFCNCSKDSDVEDVVGSNLANVQERFRSASHGNDDEVSLLSIPSAPSTPSTSTSSLYDDLTYTKQRSSSPHQQQLTICSMPSPSPVSSADPLPSILMYRLTTHHHALPHRSQQRGLLEIAMKTVKLLQKNRVLQERLESLQFETLQFVDSVMANPENCDLRDRIKYNAGDRKTVAQAIGIGH